MTLNLVTRVPKRLVRANQRHSKDILVSLRIKAPITAQRIGGYGCGNELHGLRKACFVDCGSFAHGHPLAARSYLSRRALAALSSGFGGASSGFL